MRVGALSFVFGGGGCLENSKDGHSLVHQPYSPCWMPTSSLCPYLGWDTASATLGLLVRPARWAVLGRTLASARVKRIRELLIGLSLWEEARSQLAAWWASGCQGTDVSSQVYRRSFPRLLCPNFCPSCCNLCGQMDENQTSPTLDQSYTDKNSKKKLEECTFSTWAEKPGTVGTGSGYCMRFEVTR